MTLRLGSPVARCVLTAAACGAAICVLGGPERLAAANPEVFVLLIGVPVSTAIFFAAQHLIAVLEAARPPAEGDDAAR
jgi:hypothetical protein